MQKATTVSVEAKPWWAAYDGHDDSSDDDEGAFVSTAAQQVKGSSQASLAAAVQTTLASPLQFASVLNNEDDDGDDDDDDDDDEDEEDIEDVVINKNDRATYRQAARTDTVAQVGSTPKSTLDGDDGYDTDQGDIEYKAALAELRQEFADRKRRLWNEYLERRRQQVPNGVDGMDGADGDLCTLCYANSASISLPSCAHSLCSDCRPKIEGCCPWCRASI